MKPTIHKIFSCVFCISVSLVAITDANDVVEHVIMSEEKTEDGFSYSYTSDQNKAGYIEDQAQLLSEVIPTEYGGSENDTDTKFSSEELNKYENEEVAKLEQDLDNPKTKAGQNYSTIVDSSSSPILQVVGHLAVKIKREDVCPERTYLLRYYWEQYHKRICRVVRPYHQHITFVKCTYRRCCNMRSVCIPEGWTRHRFIVLCYNLSRPYNFEWKTVTRYFPKCCDCHTY